MSLSRLRVVVGAVLVLALATTAALAGKEGGYPNKLKDRNTPASYPGLQHLHYKFGPVTVNPGQNVIKFEPIPANGRPSVPGYITSFKPNLTYLDGKVPGVDVVHLHHGVWVVNGSPTFAVGEEKTIVDYPQGFGFHYTPQQSWLMNHMVHNLEPTPRKVYITWDIDFLPDSAAAAASIKPVYTKWLDVAGVKAYPVFDSLKKWGKNRTFTFPDDAPATYRARTEGPAHEWVVRRDVTLVGTAGHLHPGGLHTDMYVTRGGRTVRLFRSNAHYWEPAGAVSWDVAMGATGNDWRVKLKKGDVVNVTGTYDTSKASWYEVMAIMATAVYNGTDAGGVDPFVTQPPQKNWLTHGRLPENSNHGGQLGGLPNAKKMLGKYGKSTINITDFIYGRSDLTRTKVPVIRAGKQLTFVNKDDNGATKDIYHTITACKAPCNRTTGIAYPIANGSVQFDSGELGDGPAYATPAAQRFTWQTPKSLKPGTYTYFCRVHPFMRGAFRVAKPKTAEKKH